MWLYYEKCRKGVLTVYNAPRQSCGIIECIGMAKSFPTAVIQNESRRTGPHKNPPSGATTPTLLRQPHRLSWPSGLGGSGLELDAPRIVKLVRPAEDA